MERRILERYFNNTCAPEERERVTLWLSDERNNDEVHQRLSEFWDDFGRAQVGDKGAGMPDFEHIRSLIPDLNTPQKEKIIHLRNRRNNHERWLYIAAACMGFVLTIGALLWLVPERHDDNGYVTVYTEKGERKQVTLSDGSEIYLNADSKLIYPSEMEMHQAAIYIEGEAFFNMTESDRPRIIVADGVETHAGAESSKFNITAFPTDSVVTVAMDDGRAEIRAEYGPLLKLRMVEQSQDSVLPLMKLRRPKRIPMTKLRPAVKMERREFAVVHKQRGNVDLFDTLNEKKAFGWKEGILYFDDADANKIVSTLERWYGVEVSFCNEGHPASTYSAEFNNEQLTNVLSELSQSLQLTYTQKGNEIYLCGK